MGDVRRALAPGLLPFLVRGQALAISAFRVALGFLWRSGASQVEPIESKT
jgi:hypothetical protein